MTTNMASIITMVTTMTMTTIIMNMITIMPTRERQSPNGAVTDHAGLSSFER